MRVLASLVLFLTACAGTPLRTPPLPPVRDVQSAVVALVDVDGYAYCTGTRVAQGILTAAHCVEDSFMVQVGFYDQLDGLYWDRSYTAAVLRVDPDQDLALLDLRRGPALREAPVTPAVGSQVMVLGHPLGYPYVAHWGHVSTPVRHWGSTPRSWYMVDAGLAPGYSGSPVLSEWGDIVGVVSFAASMPGQMFGDVCGIVSAEAIHAFLEAE